MAPAFDFTRPAGLQAAAPPESLGRPRDDVRLLVTDGVRIEHDRFRELPSRLRRGDLLIVNRSATLPASLPARGGPGEFRLHLSTRYGPHEWLAEPRWSDERPGPIDLPVGAPLTVAGVGATVGPEYPGIPRLRFVRFTGDIERAMRLRGRPIRYAYARKGLPLDAYQTVFSEVPGSAEMPSAGRPFSARVLRALGERGIAIAPVVLHAGVSSLEVGDVAPGGPPVFPEPFEVPATTAAAIAAARARGGRVIAVGTTVVRAVESAFDGRQVRPARGFTRAYIAQSRGVCAVDGLLTGLHDPRSTHLAMLTAFAPAETLASAYAEAVRQGYLWHEFGDSHLILPSAPGGAR